MFIPDSRVYTALKNGVKIYKPRLIMVRVRYFFLFDHYLEAWTRTRKNYRWFFGGIEEKKIF